MKKHKVLYYSCASRGRNPENPSDRTNGIHVEQRLEVNPTGIANCITTVEKDCYILVIELDHIK